jgi:uncharacterized protein (TIGR02118 family)
MVKLTVCLQRLASLSREEFQRYWHDTHAPLVRAQAEALRIRRYVQTHSSPDSDFGEMLRLSRGGPAGYDGVAELWWDSLEALTVAFASDEGRKAGAILLADEKRFVDLARSPLWLGDERPIL